MIANQPQTGQLKLGFFFYALKKCVKNHHSAPKKCSRLLILALKKCILGLEVAFWKDLR